MIYKIIFSPTGGTKRVAEILADKLGTEKETIDLSNPNENFGDFKLTKDDTAVIAVPSFGGRAPEVAIERLEKIKGNDAKAIIVSVYGNRDFDDTLIELFDSAVKSGFNPVAGIAAIAQHSILPQYATGRPDKKDEEKLKGFIEQIRDKDSQATEIPGNRPYKKISSTPLYPKPSTGCTSCNVCVTLCPVDAINPQTYKVDKSKCISCMRCFTICPQHARKLNKLLTGAAGLALKKEASQRKEADLFL